MSVRVMMLLVLAVGAPMGLWLRKAQLQRAAVARIEAANGAVLYDFEIMGAVNGGLALGRLDLDFKNSTWSESKDRAFTDLAFMGMGSRSKPPSVKLPPAHPWKDWARKKLGVDYVDSVTRVIAIKSQKLQDDDLAFLAEFPKLECLDLEYTPIGDRGMVQIGGLHGLKMLRLDPSKLTDACFAQLERLDQLEDLEFCEPGRAITDADLARLSGMKKLRFLTIRCPSPEISDAGLLSLEKLTNLKWLRIDAPNVSLEGLVRLEIALPKARVLRMSENEYQSRQSHQIDIRPD